MLTETAKILIRLKIFKQKSLSWAVSASFNPQMELLIHARENTQSEFSCLKTSKMSGERGKKQNFVLNAYALRWNFSDFCLLFSPRMWRQSCKILLKFCSGGNCWLGFPETWNFSVIRNIRNEPRKVKKFYELDKLPKSFPALKKFFKVPISQLEISEVIKLLPFHSAFWIRTSEDKLGISAPQKLGGLLKMKSYISNSW